MSDGKDVKRYFPCYSWDEGVGMYQDDKYGDWVRIDEHQAVVAELKAEIERLESVGKAAVQCMKDRNVIIDRLKAENDILKSKASQFESTLKETMRVRDEEIEKLKRVIEKLRGMVSHYETCATVDRYDDEDVPCDCGLEKELDAIEKESK